MTISTHVRIADRAKNIAAEKPSVDKSAHGWGNAPRKPKNEIPISPLLQKVKIRKSLPFWFLAASGLLACSCSPKAIGYQNHPLPAAYYPTRYHLHLGAMTFLDIQMPRK